MSEIRRKRGTPKLAIPQRGDPALDAEAARLQQMATAGRGGANPPMPQGMGAEGAGNPAAVIGESAVRTAEDEAAFNLGQRTGAQSLAAQAGGGLAAPERAQRGITTERLEEAEQLLMQYKSGKSSVDRRIIRAQQWWKLRNWEEIENDRGTKGATEEKSATAWLWNAIVGKHAEAMDSFPEPIVLPRMEEDKAEAEILGDILPVTLNINGFEEVYSRAQWQKFQEGTGAYYIGWDKNKMGGMGDIAIRNVSLLNLFWEPGVENIQDSENLFFVQIVNTKQLEAQYPRLKGKLKSSYLKPSEYRKDDSVSTDGKSVLVDWYYKVWSGTRKVLHYCQFVSHEILYSTENNGEENGLYNDGDYPFILDPMYPVHGSPAGYGLIDIARDAQTDIDTLNQAMVQNAVATSTPRFFIQSDGMINEDEFADWSKPFVHSNGGLGDNSIRPINVNGIQGSALSMLNNKIEELKFVTGNSDVQNGSTPAGVTAASAIAALQEYSGRASKDSTRSSYRASTLLYLMCIERIRQFYDVPRQFRILGPNGQQRFITYSNEKLKEQQLEGGMGLAEGFRKPVFDIDVRSERETAYTKLSQNELAIQFMQMGVFNPQMTDQVLMMMDMMDFRGKQELIGKIEQNGTMAQALMQMGQIAMSLAEDQPEIQAQIGMVLQQMGAQMNITPPQGALGTLPALHEESAPGDTPSDETTMVRNARERARESTRPE